MAIDFYFSDLTPEAQQRFLKAQGLSCAEDGNYDMDNLPIFILENDDEEDNNMKHNVLWLKQIL